MLEQSEQQRKRGGRSNHPWYKTWQVHKRNINCPWKDFHEFRRWAEARSYDPKAGDRIVLHSHRLFGFAPRVRKAGKPDIFEQLSQHDKAMQLQEEENSLIIPWLVMMSRAYDQKDSLYPRVGGLGIKVCPEWHDRNVFFEWAKTRGGDREGVELIRRNRAADYSPSNCVFG